jgi:cellulose synthase operon protein C
VKLAASSLFVFSALYIQNAWALEWPDVAERTERASVSADVAARQSAARSAVSLGKTRATPLLQRLISDVDPEVRIAAARAAASLKLESVLGQIPSWLGERSLDLRIAACETMRSVPDSRWVAPLSRALGDADSKVRTLAADALGSQNTPDAVVPLLGRLDDGTPAVRETAIRALGKLRDRRAVIPLVGKTQDSAPEVRQAAARVLGVLGDDRGAIALVQLTRDANQEVRLAAVRALASIKSKDTVDALAAIVRGEREKSVKHAAIVALGEIPSDEAVASLIHMLGEGDDRDAGTRESPVRAALLAQGSRAKVALSEVLGRGDAALAANSAAWVLSKLTDADDVLLSSLRAGKLDAHVVLASLRSGASLPVALEYLRNPSPKVRSEARLALLRLMDAKTIDGRVVDPVSQALQTAAVSERAQLIEILGRSGSPSAVPFILRALPSHGTEIAAVDALGNVASEGGDRALIATLSGSRPELRSHAAAALFRSGGPLATKLLLVALLDPNATLDRTAALIALEGSFARTATSAALLSSMETLLKTNRTSAERDAVLEALSQKTALPEFLKLSSSEKTAFARGSVARGPQAVSALLTLLQASAADVEDAVRAEAAWSLGSIDDSSSRPKVVAALLKATQGVSSNASPLVAINATASLAKIAGTTKNSEGLCDLLTLGQAGPEIRVNALVGLVRAGKRCGAGDRERALVRDVSPHVRMAAINLVGGQRANASSEDLRVLAECAEEERSPEILRACKGSGAQESLTFTRPIPVLIFVARDSAEASLNPFAIQFSSGLIRTGLTDLRGAVLDLAPDGPRVRMLSRE